MIVRIDNWRVGSNQTGYTAPEAVCYMLVGEIQDHPNYYGRGPTTWDTPKKVQTSYITGAKGRIVTTRSGTKYILGRINPAYRKWLRKSKPKWDWRNPFGTNQEEEKHD